MSSGEASDARLERVIGTLLRVGVSAATIVVFIGAVLFLARHGAGAPDDRTFHGEPSTLRGLSAIVQDAARPSGRGIIQLGLVLLVATPVARVVFSLFAFVARRDGRFAAITLVVVAILGYALFGPPP